MNEPLTIEQLKKFGFRLPERLPFYGFGIQHLQVGGIEDHGEFSRLVLLPSPRYIDGSHIRVEGVGKVNESRVAVDVPRSYETLSCSGCITTRDRDCRPLLGVYLHDRKFNQLFEDEAATFFEILAVSFVMKSFDLFSEFGPLFARADYVVVREPMGDPYLRLTEVTPRKHLEF